MDIEIRKDVLLRALDRCLHPSGKKDDDDGHAYVGHVMITINPDDKTANFYATNTYLCVDTAATLESISENGPRCSVDTKRLHTMAHNLRGDILQLVVRDNRLSITGDHLRRYTVPLVDASSFPALKEPRSEAPSIKIAGPKLSYILQRVGHARDTSRPHLDGVKIRSYVIDGRSIPTLEAVAINGYNVVVVQHSEVIGGASSFEAFFPTRFLKPLVDLAKDESVTLCADGNFVFAETEDTLVGALLPEGEFLDYRTMMSHVEPFEPLCELPAVAIQDALKAIMAVRTSKSACVRFQLSGTSLQLDLWRDQTKATDSVPIKLLGDRDSFEFFAEPQFVIDHMKGADGDCEMIATKAPVMFQTKDGYRGFLSPQHGGEDKPEEPEEPTKKKAAKKTGKKRNDKKDDGKPGPGKGRKKKTSKKGNSNSTTEELPPDEDDDEYGSADPSQYITEE